MCKAVFLLSLATLSGISSALTMRSGGTLSTDHLEGPNQEHQDSQYWWEKHTFFQDQPYLSKIFYINLDGKDDRANNAKQQLADLKEGQYERWPATTKDEAKKFDLEKFTTGDVEQYLLDRGDHIYGTVATFLSHARLAEHIAAQRGDDNAVYIVMEDDFKLKGEIKTVVNDVMGAIKRLPKSWDVYKFGFWGGGRCDIPEAHVVFQEDICQVTDSDADAWEHMGNTAYAVSQKGARTVLKHLKSRALRDVDGGMMPFKGEGPETYAQMHSSVENAGEFGSDRVVADDSLKVHVPEYETSLRLKGLKDKQLDHTPVAFNNKKGKELKIE